MGNNYILAVGKDGADRLETVQLLYGEESQLILKKAGLKAGMVVMDAGCGTGQMTQWIAEQVGVSGHVIAMDNSPHQLHYAKKRLDQTNLNNISYLCREIDALSIEDLRGVDLIYSRLVLVHNTNPLLIIKNIKNNCKKNTVFVFEEPITSESTSFPVSEPFNKHLELYCLLGKLAGFDYDLGNNLIALLTHAELQIKGIKKTTNYFSDFQAKSIAYQRTKECQNKYLSSNLITPEQLDRLLNQLKVLANDKLSLMTGVSMVHAWGIMA